MAGPLAPWVAEVCSHEPMERILGPVVDRSWVFFGVFLGFLALFFGFPWFRIGESPFIISRLLGSFAQKLRPAHAELRRMRAGLFEIWSVPHLATA